MLESKQSQFHQFFQIQGQKNSGCSGSICPIIELIPYFMGIYNVEKFSTDWSIFAYARFLTNSNMANFLIQGQINPTVLVRLDP